MSSSSSARSRDAVQFPNWDSDEEIEEEEEYEEEEEDEEEESEHDYTQSADDEASTTPVSSPGSTGSDVTLTGSDEESNDSGGDDEDLVEVVKADGATWKEEDGKDISCECIVCDHKTAGYEAADLMLEHIESVHRISFKKLKKDLDLDYLGFVQFVRYARHIKSLKTRTDGLGSLVSELAVAKVPPEEYPWTRDEYLLPEEGSSEIDYFLTLEYFEAADTPPDPDNMFGLQLELQACRGQIRDMICVIRRIILEPGSFTQSKPKTVKKLVNKLGGKSDDDLYFMSYDELTIHHEMIFDRPRTDAYRDAIYDQRFYIKGRRVMDLGCGTGILSMLCAKEGAKKVYAVDNAEIIYEAMSNAYENAFGNIIECMRKDVDKEDLEIEKVDILVSEFMGYFLFFEGMTETFIRARDKYLKPCGIVMPNACHVYLVPLGPYGVYQSKVNCWYNVYGFSMDSMRALAVKEIPITEVSPSETIGPAVCVKSLNLYKCKIEDIQIDEKFCFHIDKDKRKFCAIAGYFSVDFDGPNPVKLSTGPQDPQTHWKQAVFFFPTPIKVSEDKEVPCRFKSYRHPENPRWLMVEITTGGETFKYEFK